MTRHCQPLLLIVLLALEPVSAAWATTIAVPCSVPALKNAIITANGNGQSDVIDLAAGCTYTLDSVDNMDATYGPNGLPMVLTTESLVIHGHGAVLERASASGTPEFRLLDVKLDPAGASGSGYQFVMDHLTLRNGKVIDTMVSYQPAAGGLLVWGHVAADPVRLDDLQITGNQAYAGGGLGTSYAGSIELSNSTISGNTAGLYGGGLACGTGNLTVASSRIVDNHQGSADLVDQDANAYLLSGGAGVAAYLCDNFTILDSDVSGNEGYGLGGGGLGVLATPGIMINTRVHDNIINIPDNVDPSYHVEFGAGGGLAVGNFALGGGSAPEFTILRSAIYGNVALGSAGGIGVAGSVSAAINNTTISGNHSYLRGGGVGDAAQQLVLNNVTVAGNAAPRGAGIDIGSYTDLSGSSTLGTAWFINTAIGDNAGSSDCYNDGGTVSDNMASLLETDAAGANACDGAGGKSFALRGDPGLSGLADHGGPDPSHMPQPGSPLIDAGAAGWTSSPTDQRGGCFKRTRGAGIDIGAIETGNEEVVFCSDFDPSQVLNRGGGS